MILQAENVFDKSNEDIINKLYSELLDLNKPIALSPSNSNNVVLSNEISMEKLYFTLEEQGIKSPRELTVFQFEVALKKNEEEFERLTKQVDAEK